MLWNYFQIYNNIDTAGHTYISLIVTQCNLGAMGISPTLNQSHRVSLGYQYLYLTTISKFSVLIGASKRLSAACWMPRISASCYCKCKNALGHNPIKAQVAVMLNIYTIWKHVHYTRRQSTCYHNNLLPLSDHCQQFSDIPAVISGLHTMHWHAAGTVSPTSSCIWSHPVTKYVPTRFTSKEFLTIPVVLRLLKHISVTLRHVCSGGIPDGISWVTPLFHHDDEISSPTKERFWTVFVLGVSKSVHTNLFKRLCPCWFLHWWPAVPDSQWSRWCSDQRNLVSTIHHWVICLESDKYTQRPCVSRRHCDQSLDLNPFPCASLQFVIQLLLFWFQCCKLYLHQVCHMLATGLPMSLCSLCSADKPSRCSSLWADASLDSLEALPILVPGCFPWGPSFQVEIHNSWSSWRQQVAGHVYTLQTQMQVCSQGAGAKNLICHHCLMPQFPLSSTYTYMTERCLHPAHSLLFHPQPQCAVSVA